MSAIACRVCRRALTPRRGSCQETRTWRPSKLPSRRLLEGRAGIQCRRTPQIARLRLIVWPTAMHGAAIVPDDYIADPPAMAVDELVLRRVRRQIPQQQTPVGHRPAADVRCMRGEVERFALRAWMQ